jgi:hypothetical protein
MHAATFLAIILAGSTLFGQTPNTNRSDLPQFLDFEVGKSADAPVGWGGGPIGTIFADDAIIHGGKWAARLDRNPASAGNFSTMTIAVKVNFGGSRIELRGFLKTEDVGQFAGLQDLAEDYVAAVRFLQMQSGVNPRQVGIYGHSQRGTLSPLIASRPVAVAFVIAAAAIGTGPIYEQDLYRTRNELIDSGLAEQDLSRAMELYGRWLSVARTGEGWAALDQAIRDAQNEKWLPQLGLPPIDHWLYKWYPPVGNFNPCRFGKR